ncbi:MAG: hypothetical protein V5A49_00215 [Haloarcula sp.]
MNDIEEAETLGPWEQTLDDMRDVASQRATEGWETITVQAGDTAPEPPSAGESNRFGLVYTVPNDSAEGVRSFSESASVDGYTVYRRKAGSKLFLVTEISDSDARIALFVAGVVDLDVADDLVTAAANAGETYTHIRLLDSTQLGSFRHDDPSAFFLSI